MDAHSTPRFAYVAQLQELEHEMIDMAAHAEQMVLDAAHALADLDTDLAARVLKGDDAVDAFDLDIENRCIRLLALQAPIGRDLRTIGSAMKIITDIERIGDLACDVAKIAMKIDRDGGTPSIIDLPKMANAVSLMFREAIESYVHRDPERVASVGKMEDEVDGLYRDLRNQVFAHMTAAPNQLVSDGWLLLAVHHLERIADHALNIAERVTFIMTGELRQLVPSERPLA